MGECCSCLFEASNSDLKNNSGLGIVKTQVNVVNVVSSANSFVPYIDTTTYSGHGDDGHCGDDGGGDGGSCGD